MTDLPIDVIRSQRRIKTAQARVADGRVRVMIPAGLDASEEERLISKLVARVSRKVNPTAIDLTKRARELSAKYGLPVPKQIEWSSRQVKRWGSCSIGSGTIRISSQVAEMPPWVLDYVIVHELAHLAEPHHGSAFHALVARFGLSERAKGYLLAKSEVPGPDSPAST